MKLYIKQKVFSWGDKFRVYDESGRDIYCVEGEVFSLGKKLHILDNNRRELLFIHQKLLSFLPRYLIAQNGVDVAEVRKEFSLFHPVFTVEGPGWNVEGDFFHHEYAIDNGRGTVATISKQWFTWGDTYEIDIMPGQDELLVLCVVLAIDAVLAAQNAHAASTAN